MSNLHQIAAKGQSIWIDELRRAWLTSGHLQRLMKEDAVTGMTSNPTIFAETISGSTDYREQLEELVAGGADVDDLYSALVTDDIQAACDLLRPIWDSTAGDDGYVSIEVSPLLAHEAEATIQEVRAWHKRIARPNCLVKVPATPAGLPVIEQMTAEGLSINVTLIFGLERYREVVQAYMTGLERLIADGGEPSQVFSVASFFVSRVDVEVDRRLADLAEDGSGRQRDRILALRGKAGIANARTAYGIFEQLFSDARWEPLSRRGARLQKVLWASTSIKDPAYPDTMYVEALVAPHTIDTMPTSTLRAFQDHGDPKAGPFGPAEIEQARATLQELTDVGIDYEDVVAVLEREGVEKFAASFEELMECLRVTRDALDAEHWRIANISVEPDGGLVERIWARDTSIWPAGEGDYRQCLGWLTLPETMEERISDLSDFARSVAEHYDRVVLLGMGGSSLAPEMFMRTFGQTDGFPELVVLDSTHPTQIAALHRHLDPGRTLFLVSSKSGSTLETLSLYRYFRSQLDDGRHFVAVTDPSSPLQALAEREDFRACFINPPDIGGRYSALSYFGLLPAALIGADLNALLRSAHTAMQAMEQCVPDTHNPGLMIGTAIAGLAADGRDKLTFLISRELASFGDWVEQLLAESTGKRGVGIVPIVGEPPLEPPDYGPDRAFVHVGVNRELDHRASDLEEAGRAVIRTDVPGVTDVGGELYRWEFATAVAGAVLGINPFDQPDVEAAKRRTEEVLAGPADTEWVEEDPSDLFRGLEPPEYAAILAFVPATETSSAILMAARRKLAESNGVATMSSFGPRYLHSTGQLHKGGPPTVRALVVLDPPAEDLPVPGQAFGFARLITAQAAGDAQALRDAGRRVTRTTWRRFTDWVGE